LFGDASLWVDDIIYMQRGLYMRLVLTIAAILACAGSTVFAAEVSISMGQNQWPAGQRVEFSLYSLAVGLDQISAVLPDRVVCTLESGGQTTTVVARTVSGPETMDSAGGRPGQRVRYAFDLPTDLSGTVQMRISAMGLPAVLFEVVAPETEMTADSRYPRLQDLFTLYQPYLGNIFAYEPMYFLMGIEPEKSKFQISFKYRLINPESSLADHRPWVKGFHLGYTQTSFWDLESSSAPFEDTSYKPELFWISGNLMSGVTPLRGLFVQAGFQHESNGQGGDASRSTNYLYARPVFIFFSEGSHYGLQVAPKIWTYVNNSQSSNPDLDRYRGYFDLEIKFGKADSFVLGSTFRWAQEGASVQVDLTYPIHRFLFDTLGLYLHVQYTNALAESLINYDQRTHALRLGFSIVR